MVDDLKARLRDLHGLPSRLVGLCAEAADRIEKLEAAGDLLAKVGDDKFATRREWFDAITAWREVRATLSDNAR